MADCFPSLDPHILYCLINNLQGPQIVKKEGNNTAALGEIARHDTALVSA